VTCIVFHPKQQELRGVCQLMGGGGQAATFISAKAGSKTRIIFRPYSNSQLSPMTASHQTRPSDFYASRLTA
jgi:hypothetical protein